MPRYVIDEPALKRNLEVLKDVSDRAGVKILLAQKAFSLSATYALCSKYLAGTTASSLFEARHGHDLFGGETHVFAPAFSPCEIDDILGLVDHIVFNSPRQIGKFALKARERGVSAGLRVNPEVSVATTPAYDPCRPGSRLGTTKSSLDAYLASRGETWRESPLAPLEGLHFHCLCEQGLDELRKVLAGFEERFGDLLPAMKWVNFGGGHHITRDGYDVEGLVSLLRDFRRRHPHLEIYLEPGEAVALNAGILEATVLEIQPPGPDGVSNAILDASAACHMPDVLEMPYTPRVSGATICRPDCGAETQPGHVYRFGGPTCLAGDEIGMYVFAQALAEGDTVVFEDMAIYTMVKNNHFNGMRLPSVAVKRLDGRIETIKEYGYEDFARANAAS